MARSGPSVNSGFKCGNCGIRLDPDDLICRSCGSHLVTMFCERCSHRGPREEFRFNRCPVCGHRPDLGSNFLGPVFLFVVLTIILVLSFLLGR
ncbi:zinc ribbon domain-containing protein [Nitrospinota bacterium]